jgi:hypothetical protein
MIADFLLFMFIWKFILTSLYLLLTPFTSPSLLMTKYLSLLLDLFNIPEQAPLVAIGEIIAHQTKRKLIVHHRLGFVFQARYDLLLEKISLEEFLAVGDVSSSTKLWHPKMKSSRDILRSPNVVDQFPQGSMVVLDEISFLALSETEQMAIKNKLEKVDVLLLLC